MRSNMTINEKIWPNKGKYGQNKSNYGQKEGIKVYKAILEGISKDYLIDIFTHWDMHLDIHVVMRDQLQDSVRCNLTTFD